MSRIGSSRRWIRSRIAERLSESLSSCHRLTIAKAFVVQSHYPLLLLGLQHRHKRPFQSHIRRFDVTYCLTESYVKMTSRRTGNERPRKTHRLNLICVVSPYCL